MKRILFATIAAALWFCAPVQAQTMSAYTVSACGGQSLAAGQPFPLTMDLKGDLCAGGSGVSPTTPLYVASFAASPIASVTRPANTTTYTANTGWSHLTSACSTGGNTSAACYFTFAAACARNGEQVGITEVNVWPSANQSTKLQGILWLFNTAPSTIIQDNATFNIAAGDFANLTGGSFNGIPFTLASSQASGAANSGVSLTGSSLGAPLTSTCDAGAAQFYGQVQVVNAYAPLSAEVLSVQVKTLAFN